MLQWNAIPVALTSGSLQHVSVRQLLVDGGGLLDRLRAAKERQSYSEHGGDEAISPRWQFRVSAELFLRSNVPLSSVVFAQSSVPLTARTQRLPDLAWGA